MENMAELKGKYLAILKKSYNSDLIYTESSNVSSLFLTNVVSFIIKTFHRYSLQFC